MKSLIAFAVLQAILWPAGLVMRTTEWISASMPGPEAMIAMAMVWTLAILGPWFVLSLTHKEVN